MTMSGLTDGWERIFNKLGLTLALVVGVTHHPFLAASGLDGSSPRNVVYSRSEVFEQVVLLISFFYFIFFFQMKLYSINDVRR